MTTADDSWVPSPDAGSVLPNPDMNPDVSPGDTGRAESVPSESVLPDGALPEAALPEAALPEAALPEAALPQAVVERDLTPGASPELVQAFRMNAEALHRLQDMQEQLVNSVQRTNRSEMMIQSTQALNETFRNLTQVQRTLLERMDGASQRGPNRLVPLML